MDLNRAGQPLMELVFAPDLHDGEEAAALVKELSLILLQLGTCNCRMEGGFYFDTVLYSGCIASAECRPNHT